MKKEVAARGHRSAGTAPRGLGAFAGSVLGVTLLLGGAGDSYPLIALLVELSALALLWYILGSRGISGLRQLGLLPKIVVLGSIVLPVAQLVPLPPSIWHELPGQDLALRVLTLTGLAGEWRPMSLNPAATIASALEILPALAILLAALHLGRQERLRLVQVAIGVALLSAVLGALQRAAGDLSPLILFETPHARNSPGLFVNRNHQATYLLLAMLLTAGAARSFIQQRPTRIAPARLVAGGLMALFAAGVVVTGSRTGLVLLAPAAAASLMILFPIRWNWKAAAAGLVLLVGIGATASQLPAVQSTLERFSESHDERGIYWNDTLKAIGDHWPVGSGIGTFPELHASVQSIGSVGIQYVNNAHNDYLELALEGGLPALILIGLVLLCSGLAGIRLWRASQAGADTALATAALCGIGIVLLHSIVDYPLRMLSLMALFGLLWGMVLTAGNPPRPAGARQ